MKRAEPFYIDGKGKHHDDGLHDDMLDDNPEADAAFARDCIEAAIKRGVPEGVASALYRPQK